MKMAKLVFDTSSLISVSENCLMRIISAISSEKGAELIIPEGVYYESVSHPLQIRRFELNALRIKDAVDSGAIKIMKLNAAAKKSAEIIENLANSLFEISGEKISLVHAGEIETLALANSINADLIVMDERTTRMLVEDAYRLRDRMEEKYESKVDIDAGKLAELQGMFAGAKIVRSVELIAYAYEKGYSEPELKKTRLALEAALYAAKYGGCAVSLEEIQQFLKSAR